MVRPLRSFVVIAILQEWFLWALVFYCPTAVYRPSFVLCVRLLYGNRVVRPLYSLLLTAVYRSGVFGYFNLYALTAASLTCVQETLLLTVIYWYDVSRFILLSKNVEVLTSYLIYEMV